MNKHMILKRPIVTEKATLLQDRYNKYVFEVDINANRVEVAHAVEKKFDVKVDTVRIMRVKGKKKTQMTR
jgi:large subunit ribosomal protein L23